MHGFVCDPVGCSWVGPLGRVGVQRSQNNAPLAGRRPLAVIKHVAMVSSAVLIVGGGLAVATSVFAILQKRQKKAHDAPPTDGKRTLKRSGTSFVIGKPCTL